MRAAHLPVSALCLLASAACAKTSFPTPIPLDDTFPRAEPSAEALARYQAAASWSERRDGLALMVIEGGAVVFESYARGYDPSTPVHIFSGTKSFSCAIAAFAVEDGLLTLDEPVADTLPELAAGSAVTVRELLQFTSGIEQDNRVLTRDWLKKNQRVDDKYAYAVARPAETESGAAWAYGASHRTVGGGAGVCRGWVSGAGGLAAVLMSGVQVSAVSIGTAWGGGAARLPRRTSAGSSAMAKTMASR